MRFLKETTMLFSLVMIVLMAPITVMGNPTTDGNSRVYAKWEWQDASIQSVFAQLSVVSGVDIVVDQEVTGTITLLLRDKSWQEVFEVICTTNELHSSIENEYIYVLTEKTHIDRLVMQSQSERNLENVEQLQTEIINLQHTNAIDMQGPIQGIMSQRGRVTVVEHTNSLIIDELPGEMDDVRELISSLDKEMLQVSITAKIVEVGSGSQNDIGIQWSFFDNTTGGAVSHIPTGTPGSGIIPGSPLEKITYGILDQSGFSIAMEYLLSENNSEVVAEPQILTVENKEATIYMGSKIPVTMAGANGGEPTVTLIDARTELIVTPRITGDGRINLVLAPTKKSYELTDEGAVIHEQGAESEVVIQDGQTVVIAGLTTDDQQHSESGIPFLKDIPIIGYLFKRESHRESQKDLMIFVTAHIVQTTSLDLVFNEEDTSVTVEPESSDFTIE